MATKHSPAKQAATRAFLDPNVTQNLQRHYPTAFSATDIQALVMLPGEGFRALGNLAAVSISTHRDTFPVTSCTGVGVRGFTQGHRTIAGTLVFHTIDRGALLYRLSPDPLRPTVDRGFLKSAPLADTLPLFDIHINYVSESGALSFEALLGVRILDFGKTMSLENLHPVESYSYMAIDYRPMEAVVDQGVPQWFTAPARSRQPMVISTPSVPHSATRYDPEQPPAGAALPVTDVRTSVFGESRSEPLGPPDRWLP